MKHKSVFFKDNAISIPRTIRNSQEEIIVNNAGYFPVMVKNPATGSLLLFYRSGAGHLGKTGSISLKTLEDGKDWSEGSQIISGDTDLRNPAVLVTDEGKVLVAVYKYDAYHDNKYAEPRNAQSSFEILFFEPSGDLSHWQEYHPQIDVDLGHFSPYGKIVYNQGKLLMPIYDGDKFAASLISEDNGRSWSKIRKILYGYREPAITVAADGHLVCTLRGNLSIVNSSATYIAHSYDNGNIWTSPVRLSGERSHPADITTLSNGYLLATVGVRSPRQQYIAAFLSKDNGLTWNFDRPLCLNQEFIQQSDFGYPSTVEIKPGVLMTAYYESPNPDRNSRFDLKKDHLYSSKNTSCRLIHYTLKDLEDSI